MQLSRQARSKEEEILRLLNKGMGAAPLFGPGDEQVYEAWLVLPNKGHTAAHTGLGRRGLGTLDRVLDRLVAEESTVIIMKYTVTATTFCCSQFYNF
jgi:hypothetical protein